MKETPEHYPTPEESIATMVTIDDTALVFEGGGMRNAYTAALVSRLIAEGINFPHIPGFRGLQPPVQLHLPRRSALSRHVR